MLGELAVFDADDVGGDPGGGPPIAGEPAMRDHVVALGDDELVLVFQRVWRRADQVEQAVAAGRDVGAVLDIAIRPETLGGDVVALVKKGFESLQHEGPILFLDCLRHVILLRYTPSAVLRSVDPIQPRLTM
jgi:hypothetical protein